MPEGHTVHRIAMQFTADFVGRQIAATSPQGRFAAGAALLDGGTMSEARALGKNLFLAFASARDEPATRYLRVHLGLYGAWDFVGRITPLRAGGRAVGSLGAPRVSRVLRMGEGEKVLGATAEAADAAFPPEPVGQVRVRLLTDASLADLRGPIACEVLTADEVAAQAARAGPDPRTSPGPDGEEEFVRRLTSRGTPVAVLLMDQGVVSGIGNVYRAEMLHRAGLDPFTPGRRVPPQVARELWRDWVALLEDGISTGLMITRAGLDDEGRARAIADPAARHAVYGRGGEPCLTCGTGVAVREVASRRLYWCPGCQR